MEDIQEPERKPMSMREIDLLPDNPFIIRKDRYIDPNDPNLSVQEKMRLRRNWNKRRNYKNKRKNEQDIKAFENAKIIENAITIKAKEMAKEMIEKNKEQDEKKKKINDKFYQE